MAGMHTLIGQSRQMNSKSFKRKSQFEILKEELAEARPSIPKDELLSMLLQIELMLSEIDIFQTKEEQENANPIETLLGNLIGILNPAEPAKWLAALSIHIFNEIEESELESNSQLIELAFQSLNQSKNYSEKAKQYSKAEKQKEKQLRSQIATDSNLARHGPGEKLKEAAFAEYDPAIRTIQEENKTAKKKTVITYKNIAKVVYPTIEHLNRDDIGRKVIGRNGKPIEALAEIFEAAVAKGKLRSTMRYREEGLS